MASNCALAGEQRMNQHMRTNADNNMHGQQTTISDFP